MLSEKRSVSRSYRGGEHVFQHTHFYRKADFYQWKQTPAAFFCLFCFPLKVMADPHFIVSPSVGLLRKNGTPQREEKTVLHAQQLGHTEARRVLGHTTHALESL